MIQSILISFFIWFLPATDCARTVSFGPAEICLPQIEGYKECYLESPITQMADATEVPINSILGYYLDTTTYNRKAELGTFQFENYFKVYATKELQEVEVKEDQMDEIFTQVQASFIPGKWEDIQGMIDEKGLGVQLGQPVMIDHYRHNDQSFTCLALISYSAGDLQETMAMSVN